MLRSFRPFSLVNNSVALVSVCSQRSDKEATRAIVFTHQPTNLEEQSYPKGGTPLVEHTDYQEQETRFK